MADTPKYALPTREKKDVHHVQGVFGQHSFLSEEQGAFVEHINAVLSHDAFLKENGYLPIDREGDALYKALGDGILLCKLINYAVPDTIDERALNFPGTASSGGKELNAWEKKENQNIAINSAKSIGCQVVNIGATDLINAATEHKEYLVLGLIWQIVKIQLMSKVDIKHHPEIYRLLGPGEELPDLLKLSSEDVLLRWLNFHVAGKNGIDKVTNFGEALKDGKVYATLLHEIDPAACGADVAAIEDPLARTAAVIESARSLEVPVMVQAADIASGNRKLNLAFVAQIFNTRHGLEVKNLTEAEAVAMKEAFDAAGLDDAGAGDEGDAREERVFRMWMNSLNLGGGEVPPLHRLFDDLQDGIALVETAAVVAPEETAAAQGARKLNKGEKLKSNKFKCVENCNLAVDVGHKLGLSLTGIGGVDIYNKNAKLVLGFVWQLMRLQLLRKLKDVGGGKVPKDSDIVDWANATVGATGKAATISGFRDSSLATGAFLLDLLAAVEPRAINPELVTPGSTPEEREQNAKYVISVARKIGATVYLTWEDIAEVKPKMILMLVASIMHRHFEKAAATPAAQE